MTETNTSERLQLRLPIDMARDIREEAKIRRQTVTDFVKTAILAELRRTDVLRTNAESAVSGVRAILVHSVDAMRRDLADLKALTATSIAASALLLDCSSLQPNEAQTAMLDFVDDALSSAGDVLSSAKRRQVVSGSDVEES